MRKNSHWSEEVRCRALICIIRRCDWTLIFGPKIVLDASLRNEAKAHARGPGVGRIAIGDRFPPASQIGGNRDI